jgi:hypothetical protein
LEAAAGPIQPHLPDPLGGRAAESFQKGVLEGST